MSLCYEIRLKNKRKLVVGGRPENSKSTACNCEKQSRREEYSEYYVNE